MTNVFFHDWAYWDCRWNISWYYLVFKPCMLRMMMKNVTLSFYRTFCLSTVVTDGSTPALQYCIVKILVCNIRENIFYWNIVIAQRLFVAILWYSIGVCKQFPDDEYKRSTWKRTGNRVYWPFALLPFPCRRSTGQGKSRACKWQLNVDGKSTSQGQQCYLSLKLFISWILSSEMKKEDKLAAILRTLLLDVYHRVRITELLWPGIECFKYHYYNNLFYDSYIATSRAARIFRTLHKRECSLCIPIKCASHVYTCSNHRSFHRGISPRILRGKYRTNGQVMQIVTN